MAATKFSFFVISTSDRGDFQRIIEIALFLISSLAAELLPLVDCDYSNNYDK